MKNKPKITDKPAPPFSHSQFPRKKLYIVKVFNDKYIENVAYFENLSEATLFVNKNFCDINDGGSFDFSFIHIVDYEQGYAECISNRKVFFKFNKNTRQYERISKEEGEYALDIMRKNKLGDRKCILMKNIKKL